MHSENDPRLEAALKEDIKRLFNQYGKGIVIEMVNDMASEQNNQDQPENKIDPNNLTMVNEHMKNLIILELGFVSVDHTDILQKLSDGHVLAEITKGAGFVGDDLEFLWHATHLPGMENYQSKNTLSNDTQRRYELLDKLGNSARVVLGY